MKQYLNPDLTRSQILVNPAVSVGPSCLLAVSPLPPNQVLLSVKQSSTLCYSSVPQEFKWLLTFLEGVTIESEPHQLSKKIALESELLLFYLIYLRTNFADHELYAPWLHRPINGLYYFSRTVIEETENLDLLISYVATQNHLNVFAEQLFLLLSKPVHLPVLQLLLNAKECQLDQFRSLYVWSYHFVNSRSFGYTEEYTLIPVFDMINHSSRNDNVQLVLTAKPLHTQQEVAGIVGEFEHGEEGIESDNDSEEGMQSPTKVEAHFMDLYYHLVSIEDIQAGEEILLKYGHRNNIFLLEGYGFVQEFNKFDSLTVYFSTLSDEIYFDSVKGAIAIKGKLKRGTLDFSVLLNLKKYYFEKYYKKNHTKVKVLWSIPKNVEFEKYFLSQILRRMVNYRPKVHYLSELNGSHELHLWQKERRSIFEANVQYILHLCKLLNIASIPFDSQTKQMIENSNHEGKLPQSIREYAQLLIKLSQ